MRSHLTILLAAALLTCTFGLRAAPGVEDPETIRNAALEALGLVGTPSRAMVDPALRLDPCLTPLQATPTGPRTVKVRCADAPGWKLYVPVRVVKEADVVVLTRPVPAGQAITAEHVAVRRRGMGNDVAYKDPSAVIGMTAVQGLAPGTPLNDDVLAHGPLLQRGDPVVLVARAGGIEVRMAGRALGRAAPGGAVSVENLGSRRIVRGRLIGDGMVEVGQ